MLILIQFCKKTVKAYTSNWPDMIRLKPIIYDKYRINHLSTEPKENINAFVVKPNNLS